MQCEAEGRDYNTPWYKWVIERLHQVFLLVSLFFYLKWHTRAFLPVIWCRDNPNNTDGHTNRANCVPCSSWLFLSSLKRNFAFAFLSASRAGLQVHQHTGDASLHKWHWHSHPGGFPAILCAEVVIAPATWRLQPNAEVERGLDSLSLKFYRKDIWLMQHDFYSRNAHFWQFWCEDDVIISLQKATLNSVLSQFTSHGMKTLRTCDDNKFIAMELYGRITCHSP